MRIWIVGLFVLLAAISAALLGGADEVDPVANQRGEIDARDRLEAPSIESTLPATDIVSRESTTAVSPPPIALPEQPPQSTGFFNPVARIDSYFVGTVTDAATGAPIPGARVYCVHESPRVASGVADANGNYRTTGFQYSRGTYRLFAIGQDMIAKASYVPTVVSYGENRADLTIDRAGIVHVAVRDPESGNPVAGARIITAQPFEYTIGETDSRGILAIAGMSRSQDAQFEFVARKPGHFGSKRLFAVDASALGGRQVEFLVGRECRVEVITRDGDGKSIGGELDLLFSDRAVLSTDALLRLLPFKVPDGLELDIRWHQELMIDTAGTRIFGELPPLPFVGVQLIAGDRIKRWIAIDPFTECGQVRRVDMAIAIVRDPARLMGRVAMNGEPCRATVRWKSEVGYGESDSLEDGSFVVANIAPGVVTIEVSPFESIDTQSVTIGFKPGETLTQDFAFTRDPRRIAGVVMLESLPVAGATVTLAPLRGAGIEPVFRETTSDAQGRFEFRDLDPDGEFWISVRAVGFEQRGVEARSGSSRAAVFLER